MELLRKYGVLNKFRTSLIEAGADDIKTNPTLASVDFKVMKDGGSLVNLASVPGIVANSSSLMIEVSIGTVESQAKQIDILMQDQTGTKEWKDTIYKIITYGHASAQIPFNLEARLNISSGQVEADVKKWAGNTVSVGDRSIPQVEVTAINNSTLAASALEGALSTVDNVIAIREWFDGAVYFDGDSDLSGTTFPNGTLRSPVNNIDDAVTIANNNKMQKIIVNYASSPASFSSSASHLEFIGKSDTELNLGSQNIANCKFRNLKVTDETSGNENEFINCLFDQTGSADLGNTSKFFDCEWRTQWAPQNGQININPKFTSGTTTVNGVDMGSGNNAYVMNGHFKQMNFDGWVSGANLWLIGCYGHIDIAPGCAGTLHIVGGDMKVTHAGSDSVTVNHYKGDRVESIKTIVDANSVAWVGSDATLAKQNTILANLATVDTVVDGISASVESIKSTVDANSVAWGATGSATLAKQNEILANLATVDTVVDGISASVESIKSTVDTNSVAWVGSDATLAKQNTILANLATVDTVVDGISTSVESIKATVDANSVAWGATGSATLAKQNEILANLATVDTVVDGISASVESIKSTVDANSVAWVGSDATLAKQNAILANLATVQTTVDGISTTVENINTIVEANSVAWACVGGDATEAKQDQILANLATVDTAVDGISASVESIKATVDANSVAWGATGSATLAKQNEILANLATVDTVVDGISASVESIRTTVDSNSVAWVGSDATLAKQNTILANLATVDTVVDGISTSVEAIKTIVDANSVAWGATGSATLAKQNEILSNLSTVDTNVDAIVAKLPDSTIASTNEAQIIISNLSTVQTTIDGISVSVEAIKVKTDLMTFSGNNIHSRTEEQANLDLTNNQLTDLNQALVNNLSTIDASVEEIRSTVEANSVNWGAVSSQVTVAVIKAGALASIDSVLSSSHGAGSWVGEISLTANTRIKNVTYDDYGNPTNYQQYYYANRTDVENDENETRIVDVTTSYVQDAENENRWQIANRIVKDITP